MKNKVYFTALCVLLLGSSPSLAGAKYSFTFHNDGGDPVTVEAINQLTKVGDPDTYSHCMGDNWLTPPPSAPVTIAAGSDYTVKDITDKNTGSCGDAVKYNSWRISSANNHARFINVQFSHQDDPVLGWTTMIKEYYGGPTDKSAPNPSDSPRPVMFAAKCDGVACLYTPAGQRGNSAIDIYVGD